jgi:surface-anchored protein
MNTMIRMSLISLLAAIAVNATAAAQTHIQFGHNDFMEVSYSGANSWSVAIHASTLGTEFEPIFVPAENRWRFDHTDGAIFDLSLPGTGFFVPAGNWGFTGASEGQFVRASVQNPSSPLTRMLLGFADGEDHVPGLLEDDGFGNDLVTFTMTVLSGPPDGHVSFYRLTNPPSDSPFGTLESGSPLLATADGVLSFSRGLTHTDANMLFSQPGTYELQFVFSGVRVSDGQVDSSEPYVYLFNVAPVPEPAALATLSLVLGGVWVGRTACRRWRTGS